MTKLLDQAVAEARGLSSHAQDLVARRMLEEMEALSQGNKICDCCGSTENVQHVCESPPSGFGDLVEVTLCRNCCFVYSQWRVDPATEFKYPTIRVTPDVTAFVRERNRPAAY